MPPSYHSALDCSLSHSPQQLLIPLLNPPQPGHSSSFTCFLFHQEMKTFRKIYMFNHHISLPAPESVYPAFVPVTLDRIPGLPDKVSPHTHAIDPIPVLMPQGYFSSNSPPLFCIKSFSPFFKTITIHRNMFLFLSLKINTTNQPWN